MTEQTPLETASVGGEQPRVCSFYLTARGCIKGDACDFAHPAGQAGSQGGAAAGAQGDQPRVCSFYITPKGCIKGDACDFAHPVAPNGAVTTRLCDFFSSARGCTKGAECDFLHVPGKTSRPAPVGGGQPCKFFQMPQGCIKGAACEFFHPGMPQMGYGAQMGQMGQYGAPPPMMGGMGKKQCDFFLSPRGCVKGDACDFSHGSSAPQFGAPNMQGNPYMQGGMPPLTGAAPGGFPGAFPVQKRAQKCEFFSTERGCIKGEMCDFIHVKDKVCDFFASERGCRKGKLCDFQHPDGGEGATEGGESSRPRAKRYAPY